MFRFRKKSILFHNPDYHCTYFYQQELIKLGWRADIFAYDSYPEKLLYHSKEIKRSYKITKKFALNYTLWLLTNFFKYKYILYYGRPVDYGNWLRKFHIKIRIEPMLSVMKLFGIKIIYLPTGCNDEFTRERFIKFDNGNVCANCGFFERCDDERNKRNLYIVNRYADLVIGHGFTPLTISNQKHVRWKSFDLEKYRPTIEIPQKFLIPSSSSFKILHSTRLEDRNLNGKNIKGSRYIESAVERLINEGFNCELIRVTDANSADMRFFQAQADLIVDQLIYGHWGSSALEGIALGKPVICYFSSEWKKNYIDNLSIDVWPFIEANPGNIYDVLKELINNPILISKYSKLSEEFAIKYLDVKKNVNEFVKLLESI
jgi:hypothetical protein